MNGFFIKMLSHRWLLHLLFWLLAISDAYFGNLKYMTSDALTRHLLISVSIHLVQVYFNIFYLYPRLFEKGKVWQYVLSLFVCVLFFAGLANLLYLDAGILNDTPYRYFFFRQFYVQGLTTGAKFLRSGIYNYFILQKMQEEQRKAEINLLRSQVNPHFLFNTLNNLYSLTLKQSPQAPETVLRLSELMRYMTGVSGLQQVPLQHEVSYLQNYIALEKLRLNSDAHIDLQIQGDFSQHPIAPLLLIPFVENAFKHGVETQTENIWVEIIIALQGSELYFYISNTRPLNPAGTAQTGGTGLANVKKRLELVYTGRYSLVIKEDTQHYTVKLMLHL